jgi:hypothetical protein
LANSIGDSRLGDAEAGAVVDDGVWVEATLVGVLEIAVVGGSVDWEASDVAG